MNRLPAPSRSPFQEGAWHARGKHADHPQHRSNPARRGGGRRRRLPPLRPPRRGAACDVAALSRQPRQLGSGPDRCARIRARGDPGRLSGRRVLARRLRPKHRRYGQANDRVRHRARREQAREPPLHHVRPHRHEPGQGYGVPRPLHRAQGGTRRADQRHRPRRAIRRDRGMGHSGPQRLAAVDRDQQTDAHHPRR